MKNAYGVKRLSLGGKVLGGLDFVDCCRTCIDQRCVDVCGYDSISSTPKRAKSSSAKTSAPAAACARWRALTTPSKCRSLTKNRCCFCDCKKEKKLDWGDNKPRKAKPRRVASKCDHCASFEDQACISACPTDAIVEMSPDVAFVDRTLEQSEAAKGGYERSAFFKPASCSTPKSSSGSLRKPMTTPAPPTKTRRRAVDHRVDHRLYRLFPAWGNPAPSLRRPAHAVVRFWYQRRFVFPGPDEVDMALNQVGYRPYDQLWLVARVHRQHADVFVDVLFGAQVGARDQKLGYQRGWFNYHVWSGPWVRCWCCCTARAGSTTASIAIWGDGCGSAVGGSSDGLSPRSCRNAPRARSCAWRTWNASSPICATVTVVFPLPIASTRACASCYARVADPKMHGFVAGGLALYIYLRDVLVRPFRSTLLRARLTGIKDPAARSQVASVATEMAEIECRRVLLPRIEPLFREWKLIHIPFAIILTIVGGIPFSSKRRNS